MLTIKNTGNNSVEFQNGNKTEITAAIFFARCLNENNEHIEIINVNSRIRRYSAHVTEIRIAAKEGSQAVQQSDAQAAVILLNSFIGSFLQSNSGVSPDSFFEVEITDEDDAVTELHSFGEVVLSRNGYSGRDLIGDFEIE